MRRTRTVAGAGLAALLLAACGSSSHKTAAQAPTTPSTPPASSATSPSTTSTPATTPSPAVPSSICRASGLRLSYLGQQGATGHGELGFALRNTSGRSCHTVGYPGIQFLDRSDRALPTIPTHTTRDLAGSMPQRALTVAPGASVSFRLFVTHFGASASSAGCATAHSLQVIPPNDTSSVRVAIGDGGGFECRTVTVSPVQPGTTAYP